MRKLLLGICVSLLLHHSCEPAIAGEVKPTMYEEFYDQLHKISPDPARGSRVANLILKRDVATFTFKDGELFLCTPVANRTCVAVFRGNGLFTFTPPLQVERDQLHRVYEREALEEPFDFMMIIFADSTLRQLSRAYKFGELPAIGFEKKIHNCLRYLGDEDSKECNPEIMKTLLEFQSNELFYAYVDTKDRGAMIFEIDPFEEEEVSLKKRADIKFHADPVPETVCQFHTKSCYAAGIIDHRGGHEFIRANQYRIESKITADLDFSASAEMEVEALKENQQWLHFHLYEKLIVDSVSGTDGRNIIFFKGKDNPILWVYLNPPLEPSQSKRLKVNYHGELLRRNEDLSWIELRSPDEWYPRRWHSKALYDFTFHTPANMQFSAVGTRTSLTTEGNMTTSHWVMTKPARNTSFNLGYFKELNLEGDSLPPVTVQVSTYGHHVLAQEGVRSGSNMEQDVGTDVRESMRFFRHFLGKCSADHIYATEIPAAHGEAFPGLIHLSWWTFQQREESGEEEIFRAHEVAHQWWGIGVDFNTYHDQWLSEAFSDYSGLWYMQAALHDNTKFFDQLKKWKDQILNNRKFLFGSGQESGPIWLGYRTQSSSTQGDYDLIIYKKGAWVIHMLRMMLVDQKTMNEDKFEHILRTFYEKYADTSASTSDFQRVVEAEMGVDMSWFFKQWVFDTRIPKYTFSYKAEEAPEGKYKVTCRVEQAGVAEDFQMVLPLFVDFGDRKFVRLRAIAKGPLSQFELPLLPMKPEKIVLNDMESVLCEVEYSDWK